MINQNIYINTKEEARQRAIDIQQYISQSSLSYGELVEIQNNLYNLAKRFGLVREFKNEGLI
jgi:hypothetical protein